MMTSSDRRTEIRERLASLCKLISYALSSCTKESLQGFNLSDWDTVLPPLQIASSIENISTDISFLQEYANDFDDNFNSSISEKIDIFLRDFIIFQWEWIAFEEISRAKKWQESTKCDAGAQHIHLCDSNVICINELQEKILQFAPCQMKEKITEKKIKLKHDNNQIPMIFHTPRLTRNYYTHNTREDFLCFSLTSLTCNDIEDHINYIQLVSLLLIVGLQFIMETDLQSAGISELTTNDSGTTLLQFLHGAPYN